MGGRAISYLKVRAAAQPHLLKAATAQPNVMPSPTRRSFLKNRAEIAFLRGNRDYD